MAASRRKKKVRKSGRAVLPVVLVIVLLLAGVAAFRGIGLREKDAAYASVEQELKAQIAAEEARTVTLEQRKVYVQTVEYIEKIAKERLSLVYPDEILFRSH